MVQFSIDERAVKNFAVFFGSFIKEQIETFYNPDFLIDFGLKAYSFSFYEKQIIICSIEGNNITDIKCVDYKEFIPDVFLEELLAHNSIPSRIHRYKKIGIERLRLEIADELMLGAITAKDTTAVWENYQMKIKISPKLQMEHFEFDTESL
ncbi:hypothetical protein [Bacillus cereus]|uniref:hypothetical protein n=1 Tax=Bacillus cereus TaxID=1396 RepID=UPI001F244D12|nr:hypothetical protein [Bacillus cereus]MCE7038199.1 hypothetical protein [Bacillus cereus]